MKLSVGKKLAGNTLVTFLLFIVTVGVVYSKLSTSRATQLTIVELRWPVEKDVSNILSNLNHKRADLRDGMLFHDDAEKVAKANDARKVCYRSIQDSLARLEVLAPKLSPENRDRISVLQRDLPAVELLQDQVEEASVRGDLTSAVAILKDAGTLSDRSRKAMEDLMDSNTTQTSESLKASSESMQSAIFWLVLCLVAVVAFGSALSYFLTHQITTGLGIVQVRAQAIASGDLLGDALKIDTGDEIEDLTNSMNLMQHELRQVLEAIASSAERGATATEQISRGTSQAANNSSAQTDQTQQVATAMHEMMATVIEISNGSRSAADAAHTAAKTAKEGGEVVNNTVETIKRIADSNQKISERVSKLGSSSQEVGRIASVIDDIADQTNLLALNAAIEAARAGEQGRGFAVVADEVRKLAERTASATKEIAEIVQNIHAETQEAVAAMEQGSTDVNNGVAGADQAGKALVEIISMATKVGDMVSQIATAATEQSSTSESINSNVENIATMIKASDDAAHQTADSCSELSNVMLDLQKVIGHFKIEHQDDSLRSRVTAPSQKERSPRNERQVYDASVRVPEYQSEQNQRWQ